MKKIPLWELLVVRGLAEDRKSAEGWILTGKVLVNNQRADSAGERVLPTIDIRIKGLDHKYVGKGGLKLEGALTGFQVDVSGRIALDTGASTGGFTDCLLQRGAARVYAIDAGYDQLAGKLRSDPRVVNMERTNIGDVTAEQLVPRPSVATVDLSYLSLRKAIPILAALLEPDGELICLVKPLFEISDSEARRTGVIEHPDQLREVLLSLVQYTQELGYSCLGITHSPITGNTGTHEFFMHIKLAGSPSSADLDQQIDQSVDSATKLTPYRKS